MALFSSTCLLYLPCLAFFGSTFLLSSFPFFLKPPKQVVWAIELKGASTIGGKRLAGAPGILNVNFSVLPAAHRELIGIRSDRFGPILIYNPSLRLQCVEPLKLMLSSPPVTTKKTSSALGP